MGKSKIEWTDATWNPVTGCTPISPGCANCYAKRMSKRLAGRGGYPADDPFRVTLHSDKLTEPLKWRKPRKVFVCSMGDLFHEDVPDEWIDKVISAAILCRHHIFLLLTKRPSRMAEYFSSNWEHGAAHHAELMLEKDRFSQLQKNFDRWLIDSPNKPLRNLWLGVTAENQEQADKRIPILLQLPAAVRFVSIEPMLGPVNLWGPKYDNPNGGKTGAITSWPGGLDWVICGGETGPGARPMHPDWPREIRDECQAAGTPFFFKQWGEWTARCPQSISLANREMAFRHGTTFYKVGKKAAGRLLDGVEWSQYPEVR
jgi:protein gp37